MKGEKQRKQRLAITRSMKSRLRWRPKNGHEFQTTIISRDYRSIVRICLARSLSLSAVVWPADIWTWRVEKRIWMKGILRILRNSVGNKRRRMTNRRVHKESNMMSESVSSHRIQLCTSWTDMWAEWKQMNNNNRDDDDDDDGDGDDNRGTTGRTTATAISSMA